MRIQNPRKSGSSPNEMPAILEKEPCVPRREQNLKLDELSPAKISRPLLVYNEKKIAEGGEAKDTF